MNKQSRDLRISLICGFILLIIAGSILVIFHMTEKNITPARQDITFGQLLRGWDAAFDGLIYTEREFDYLNEELNRIEERAVTVESWLSVLKRRRALANIHQPSVSHYRRSIDNALKAYPASQPIIAVACAALIKNSAVNRENEEQLRIWLSSLSDTSLNSLRLAIHVLAGDFTNLQRASLLPVNLFSDGTESVSIDLAVLKIFHRNYSDAASDIQRLLYSSAGSFAGNTGVSAQALRFAAEFHFDFGEMLRSAEIFSYLSVYDSALNTGDWPEIQEFAMIRQADALYLAGYIEMASAIWSILAENSVSQKETGLYNLSVTSNDQNKAVQYLERLVNAVNTAPNTAQNIRRSSPHSGSHNDVSRAGVFGLIRYSRLFDYIQALGILQGNKRYTKEDYPYIDLEISKRFTESQIPGRQIAETWLLLDRHETNEDLYKWAAWLFTFQRRFDEARILLDRIELPPAPRFTGKWINVYKAIQLMYDGDLEKAENILRAIPAAGESNTDWLVYANLGRILETTRSASRALEHYEIAASTAQNPKTAARIQLAIAKCYMSLNRPNEARHALITASRYDPDNVTIRLELDRFF